MSALPRSCLFLILWACLAAPAAAQQETASDRFSDFSAQAFGSLFGESEAERKALAAVEISKEEERRIGKAALEEFLLSLRRQRIRVRQRGEDAEYIQQLVDQIHPLLSKGNRYEAIEVHVANSKLTDARAFPGGAIVLTTGLINFCQSEAALVGVLAHELSHIDRQHQLRPVRTVRLAQDGFATSRGIPAGMLFARQFARPFRAEDEVEADLDATRWTLELGYDPLEMARLFRRLHQRDEKSGHPSTRHWIPSFLRTHPYHDDRYQAVEQYSQQLTASKPRGSLYVGRQNLRQRVPASVKRLPD